MINIIKTDGKKEVEFEAIRQTRMLRQSYPI